MKIKSSAMRTRRINKPMLKPKPAKQFALLNALTGICGAKNKDIRPITINNKKYLP